MAVKDENIVGLFAALLAERRVLLTASKLSTVRRGTEGLGEEAMGGTDSGRCSPLRETRVLPHSYRWNGGGAGSSSFLGTQSPGATL